MIETTPDLIARCLVLAGNDAALDGHDQLAERMWALAAHLRQETDHG